MTLQQELEISKEPKQINYIHALAQAHEMFEKIDENNVIDEQTFFKTITIFGMGETLSLPNLHIAFESFANNPATSVETLSAMYTFIASEGVNWKNITIPDETVDKERVFYNILGKIVTHPNMTRESLISLYDKTHKIEIKISVLLSQHITLEDFTSLLRTISLFKSGSSIDLMQMIVSGLSQSVNKEKIVFALAYEENIAIVMFHIARVLHEKFPMQNYLTSEPIQDMLEESSFKGMQYKYYVSPSFPQSNRTPELCARNWQDNIHVALLNNLNTNVEYFKPLVIII